MARAALDWRIVDLAERANIAVSTIYRFESGQRDPIPATLTVLRQTFEQAGVEFCAEDGVRLKSAL
jgi:transcriptional regulator with XRE-family HTH domain